MKDLTIEDLKAIGLKVTPQRHAILKILNQNGTHPSAETIYRELLRKFPGISFATVYSTLSKLAVAEKIQELNIDPQKKRFDPYLAPHYHFYCRVCGKVFDIIREVPFPPNINPTERENINGHQVDTVQVNLKGVCRDCRKKRLR